MRATASKAALLGKCQAWARGDAEWGPRSTSEASERGNALHSVAEQVIKTGAWPEGYTPADDEELRMAHALSDWVDEHRKPSWLSEVAFAWLPVLDQARVLQLDDHRGYEGFALEGEMCGTADVVSVEGDVVRVYDFKTGRSTTGAWDQLRALALFAARAYGVERASIHVVHVTPEGVSVYGSADDCELDMFDLQGIAGELAEVTGAIEASEPRPGEHCGDLFCPALTTCPATRDTLGAAQDLIPADDLVRRREFPLALRIESPDHAAWLLERVRVIEKVCEQIRDGVGTYVGDGDGVQLADGSTLKKTFRRSSGMNLGMLERLAVEKGATPEEIALCMRSGSVNAGIKVVGKPKAARKRAA